MTVSTSPEQGTAHAIGSISMTNDGIWHIHYVGYFVDPRNQKPNFGQWVESGRNLNKLMKIVGSRLENARQVYLDKIHEVEHAESNKTTEDTETGPSDPGLRDGGTGTGGLS